MPPARPPRTALEQTSRPAVYVSCAISQSCYNPRIEIFYYLTARRENVVEKFINAQNKLLRATLYAALDRIRTDGQTAQGVEFRQIRGKLWEIKVHAGGAGRVFYVMRSAGEMVLLHAYLKKTPKTPPREVQIAERRMGEVLAR